ncbi:MAG TPA: hypothetical protein VEA69_10095 [Tepidisphaeraceae bacterium]|nr:hypothetical protein [Tepidisphaeraceae bacterium]
MQSYLTDVLAIVGALVMRAGFAVQSAGQVRSKNSAAAIARHLADFCVAVLAFWAVGMAIQFAGNRFLGLKPSLLVGWDGAASTLAFPGVVGVLIATAIVPGVLAERARFWPSLWTGVALAAVVVPVSRAWTTATGFLGDMGIPDALGAISFHWAGAVAAAVGAIFVGARTGKFNRDGSSTAIPGHSVPLAGAGLFLLVVGFVLFGVRAGGHTQLSLHTPNDAFRPAAAIVDLGGLAAAKSLLLAAAAGGLAAVIFSQLRYYKPDLQLTAAGVLGALVAASAGGGALSSVGAVVTGALAGVLVPLAILVLDVRFRIDDPSGGIAVHGIGAALGALTAPLLAQSGTVADRAKSLGAAALGLVLIGALAAGVSVLLWTLLRRTTPVRVKEHDEFDGLDLAEHDVGAYPDFQQNTIKSYHLREV